jgi:hypothetical protein
VRLRRKIHAVFTAFVGKVCISESGAVLLSIFRDNFVSKKFWKNEWVLFENIWRFASFSGFTNAPHKYENVFTIRV